MSTSQAPSLFAGERLVLARQLAGLRKSELAARIGKSATAVSAWEAGTKRPTAANVTELAVGLGVTPAFFAPRGVASSVPGSVPHFRSLRSTSQKARDQAFAYGLLAVDIADAVEKHVEFPEISVPSIEVTLDDGDDGPEEAARELRRAWGIRPGPVKHLVRTLEQHGILLIFSPTQTSAVDAYSFDSSSRPVVVLNPVKNDYYRQRFDVAHELGHLVMHRDAEPGGRLVEDQAHRFASELLLPAADLRPLLPTAMNARSWDTFGALKEQWGVSIQALLFRARRLGAISDVTYRNAVITLTQRGWRRSEPGLVTAVEQPSMLPRSLEILEEAGISRDTLIDQARAPRMLFDIATARVPIVEASDATVGENPSNVVSLLGRRRQSGAP
ncbi:ImmA/IrrE family metallo-endopeptidase [Mycetocola manganoxydans]|uniref:ImmA/IrrE family metallo-endopeptidase n=1 Tax=Mycetocola manganoxydans TaxID=699879 RepID=A0A3L6ZUY2_9MICO|nr:XRE family transcriptional regulator [Mycetocola manganoxydans]RLP71361.1 ImmA/IrrE family metallo-endopeptidase [Mycetocola manganoxydans]GHD46010.1 DNA-binding protein [Mycetocola manganoxydans]